MDKTPPASEKRPAGRPSNPIEVIAEQLWKSLKTAGAGSLFFGEKSLSQLRSLQRYAVVAGQKMMTEKNTQTLQCLHLARKKIQVMDSLVRMFMAWQRRTGDNSAATASFCRSWDAMLSFAKVAEDESPALRVECSFMYDLRLEVLATADHKKLLEAVVPKTLHEQYGFPSSWDVVCFQGKHIGQAITQCLVSSKSLADCKASLSYLAYVHEQMPGSFEKAISEDFIAFFRVVQPIRTAFMRQDVQGFKQLCESIPKVALAPNAELARPFFLPSLQTYPQFGKAIVREAHIALTHQENCLHFKELILEFTEIMQLENTRGPLEGAQLCDKFAKGLETNLLVGLQEGCVVVFEAVPYKCHAIASSYGLYVLLCA